MGKYSDCMKNLFENTISFFMLHTVNYVLYKYLSLTCKNVYTIEIN